VSSSTVSVQPGMRLVMRDRRERSMNGPSPFRTRIRPDHANSSGPSPGLATPGGDGRTAKARQLYERALAIQQREYGPNHHELATL
jgi:hypothetical protein